MQNDPELSEDVPEQMEPCHSVMVVSFSGTVTTKHSLTRNWFQDRHSTEILARFTRFIKWHGFDTVPRHIPL